MEVVILWLVLRVYPVIEPQVMTGSAVQCVILADKMLKEDDNQILRCIPVQFLREEI